MNSLLRIYKLCWPWWWKVISPYTELEFFNNMLYVIYRCSGTPGFERVQKFKKKLFWTTVGSIKCWPGIDPGSIRDNYEFHIRRKVPENQFVEANLGISTLATKCLWILTQDGCQGSCWLNPMITLETLSRVPKPCWGRRGDPLLTPHHFGLSHNGASSRR
jgi:hypothetical protein